MADYKIFPVGEKYLLVIILSKDDTSSYWNDMLKDLRVFQTNGRDIYFDFMYRNGLKNRYFKSKNSSGSDVIGKLKKCKAPEECMEKSDLYFFEHTEDIENSVLSLLEQFTYTVEVCKRITAR